MMYFLLKCTPLYPLIFNEPFITQFLDYEDPVYRNPTIRTILRCKTKNQELRILIPVVLDWISSSEAVITRCCLHFEHLEIHRKTIYKITLDVLID